ncbi:MAG: YqiA/YcfP family alpha/beta fold hydrolase [Hydrogenophaga sp.]|uniref:YqiA/YcfP family alpha/beta fold hydrolase n=1 Tax=Hydrogenophaga sp. TaxID=1904254 RepID=UPI002722FE22|nr:YqiA/YcfP family alpha/beta fold hydrolase [Hydrogenophaga sp.]MDO9146419.1 YqiA/YcfP family alpha/beta fold hydrolase [Hydrogenophaga sp.]MDO9605503.1 YqiA/YcfP family alpha/beta fold hydrolase [Hydrogenophaga sp.]
MTACPPDICSPLPTTHLLYLHGFRSSPQSMKAQKVAARVAAQHPGVVWWCPQLPPSPKEAMALVMEGVRDWPRESMAVAGSSLGGFYARWLAIQTGCAKALLLNPAVFPARDLLKYVGEQTRWHDPSEHFVFQPGCVDELRTQESDIARLAALQAAKPERQWAIVAQGDEVLDWREMLAFCAGGAVHLLPGSDHAISDFDEHIGAMFGFLNLKN